jgi:hypothetical protein
MVVMKASRLARFLAQMLALSLLVACTKSAPQVVQILEVSTLDYYGELGAEVRCSNSADRPYFYTLRIDFMDDNRIVKEVQEPSLLIGGGETDDLGFKSSHPGVTRVRCSIRNCSPQ